MKTKNRKSPAFEMIILILIASVVVFALICAMLAADMLLPHADKNEKTVGVFKGSYKQETFSDKNVIFRGGIPYLELSSLSKYCSYGIAGDKKTTAVFFEDGGYAEFSDSDNFVINGEKAFLEAKPIRRKNGFYIPMSFFRENVSGLRFTDYEDKPRIDIDVSQKYYSLKNSLVPQDSKVSESKFVGAKTDVSAAAPKFLTDLSAYEIYMNPSEKDKYLFLVNSDNPIEKDYIPENLSPVTHTRKDGRAVQQMELYAAKALEAMLTEAAANGYSTVSVTSAYRSYEYQTQRFNEEMQNMLGMGYSEAEAKALVAQEVALPGTSEHQTGLCADMHNLSYASTAFKDTEEYEWLVKNCAKFGFILRYPAGKTDITKITFEPWHYRYVGRYHAERIMASGLCLEEYMANGDF